MREYGVLQARATQGHLIAYSTDRDRAFQIHRDR